MKKIQILATLMLLTVFTFAQKADDIIGKYHLPNNLDIEIFKSGNEYHGKIVGLNGFEDGQTKDVKNEDESQRDKPLLGKVVLTGLKYDSTENEWIDGQMYGPEKGMYFNLKVTEMRDNEIEVVGSKYLFWHTLTWKKM